VKTIYARNNDLNNTNGLNLNIGMGFGFNHIVVEFYVIRETFQYFLIIH